MEAVIRTRSNRLCGWKLRTQKVTRMQCAANLLCEACSALFLHDVSPRAINFRFQKFLVRCIVLSFLPEISREPSKGPRQLSQIACVVPSFIGHFADLWCHASHLVVDEARPNSGRCLVRQGEWEKRRCGSCARAQHLASHFCLTKRGQHASTTQHAIK